MTATPIHIQLGLFGGFSEIAGTHVVSAHTRALSDGTEVFVGEHLRWNRGRSQGHTTGRRRSSCTPPDAEPSLFDALRPPSTPPPVPAPSHHMEEVELYPGAVQLPLWAA